MRNTKTVYTFDDSGVFAGIDTAFESWDLNGVFLLPANSTEEEPPAIAEGYFAKWNGLEWQLESVPTPEVIVEPEPEPITWDQIRSQRNYLISLTDWIFAPDIVLTNKEAWLTYRQALRDVPQNYSAPEEVVWPTTPE